MKRKEEEIMRRSDLEKEFVDIGDAMQRSLVYWRWINGFGEGSFAVKGFLSSE